MSLKRNLRGMAFVQKIQVKTRQDKSRYMKNVYEESSCKYMVPLLIKAADKVRDEQSQVNI